MSPANAALVAQATGIVATLGLRAPVSILVETNNLGPVVAISDIKTVLTAAIAAITALDP